MGILYGGWLSAWVCSFPPKHLILYASNRFLQIQKISIVFDRTWKAQQNETRGWPKYRNRKNIVHTLWWLAYCMCLFLLTNSGFVNWLDVFVSCLLVHPCSISAYSYACSTDSNKPRHQFDCHRLFTAQFARSPSVALQCFVLQKCILLFKNCESPPP